MGKSLVYKKSTVTTLKAIGTLELDKGVINVEGEEIPITELLKDFDNLDVEISMKIKDEEELSFNDENNM